MFSITLQTFVGAMKNERETEQVAVRSDGAIIHQKITDNELVFSHEVMAEDMQMIADFFSSDCIQSIKGWRDIYCKKYYCPDRFIFSDPRAVYHRWIVEYAADRKLYCFYGDTIPEQAEDISRLVLSVHDFKPVPDLFFLNGTGNR